MIHKGTSAGSLTFVFRTFLKLLLLWGHFHLFFSKALLSCCEDFFAAWLQSVVDPDGELCYT